jgi:hypothetical protein
MKKYELDIPYTTITDENAFELMRVWAAHGKQHVAINAGLHQGAEGFGIIIGELILHGVSLYSERENISEDEAAEKIIKTIGQVLSERSASGQIKTQANTN